MAANAMRSVVTLSGSLAAVPWTQSSVARRSSRRRSAPSGGHGTAPLRARDEVDRPAQPRVDRHLRGPRKVAMQAAHRRDDEFVAEEAASAVDALPQRGDRGAVAGSRDDAQ